MSVERTADTFVVTDTDGARLVVHTFPSSPAPVVFASSSDLPTALNVDDGLALIAFLADALGVERLGDDATPCSTCGVPRGVHGVEFRIPLHDWTWRPVRDAATPLGDIQDT